MTGFAASPDPVSASGTSDVASRGGLESGLSGEARRSDGNIGFSTAEARADGAICGRGAMAPRMLDGSGL